MAIMAFKGTSQKCEGCEKTVYLVDRLTADGRVYHKSCFRCHHCKATLKLSNYSSFEGVLYCKPHYDQLLKTTGRLGKSFEGAAARSAKTSRSINHENNATSRISSMFVGTQDKCVVCKKTVYPIEKVAIDGSSYHKACFKCSHGGCVISPSNYISHEGNLYCKHHHAQLLKAMGDFRQLEEKHQHVTKLLSQDPSATRADLCQLEDRHQQTTELPSVNPTSDGDFRQLQDKLQQMTKPPSGDSSAAQVDLCQLEDRRQQMAKLPSVNPTSNGDFRQLEDKLQQMTKPPSEDSSAARGDLCKLQDGHQQTTELPSVNPTSDGDFRKLEDKLQLMTKLPSEDPSAVGDAAVASPENPIANGNAEENGAIEGSV